MATQYKDIISNTKTKHYHIIACQIFWREFSYYASLSKHMYSYSFLKQGLHNSPDILRETLQKKIDEISSDKDDEGTNRYHGVLLGYGLCSKGIEGIKAKDIPVVVARAHDCITLFLGSKERYREYFDAHPGTFWYTPGWIDSMLMPGADRDKFIEEYYTREYGEENAQYLVEIENIWKNNYDNIAYTDLGISDNKEYKKITKESSEYLKWNIDEIQGNERLIVNLLNGDWNEKEYLVLNPGETLVATDEEETIIGKK